MSQFLDTKHANEAASKAFQEYSSDMERIKNIKEMLKNGETPTAEELLWVCQRAEFGIISERSSWYSHG